MKNFLFSLFAFLFLGCFLSPPSKTGSPDAPLQQACFTPGCVVQSACQLFYEAQGSIYLSMYHLDHPQILHCLKQNTERSLDIQVVTDLSHADPAIFSNLVHRGVKLFPGSENGLMHKYLIIDRQKVLTGSANFSTSLESSHNLTLLFHSPSLASYYLKDFSAYQSYRFGSEKTLPLETLTADSLTHPDPIPFFTPYLGQYSDFYTGGPFQSLDKHPLPVYEDLAEWGSNQSFTANGIWERGIDLDQDQINDLYLKDIKKGEEILSPSKVIYQLGPLPTDISQAHQNALNALLFFVGQARESLTLAAYSLTEPTLLGYFNKLARAKKIRLTILMDYQQAKTMRGNSLSLLLELQRNCSCVFLYQNPGKTLHHKFIYLDKQKLLAGSLNFSTSAFTSNDENFLFLEDTSSFKLFLEREINTLLSHSLPLSLDSQP